MPDYTNDLPDSLLLAVEQAGATSNAPAASATLGADGAMATEAAAEAQEDAAAPSPAVPNSGGFFAPLRIGGFRLLIGGQTISRLGDAFFTIAIPWLVLRISQQPLALSLVVGALALTTGLFTLVGGVLADRLGPRVLMIGSDVMRLVLMAVLAALALLTTPTLWELVTISALLGIATGLFFPASGAMIPFLVPRNHLQAANGIEQLSLQSSNFAGPAIAGVVLYATQLAFGFVLDAVTYAVSVFTLIFVWIAPLAPRPPRESSPTAPSKGGLRGGLADLGEAFRFLRQSPFLFTVVSLSIVANFGVVGIFEVALPLLLKQMVGVDDGPRALGVIVSGLGLGSIVGAIVAGLAGRLPHKPLVAILLFVPIVGLVASMPFVGDVYALAGIFAAMGLFLGASNVLFITVIQRFIPMEMMGRMISITMLGSFVGGPLSIFVYGALATLSPEISYLFVGGAAVLSLACILALTKREIWQTP